MHRALTAKFKFVLQRLRTQASLKARTSSLPLAQFPSLAILLWMQKISSFLPLVIPPTWNRRQLVLSFFRSSASKLLASFIAWSQVPSPSALSTSKTSGYLDSLASQDFRTFEDDGRPLQCFAQKYLLSKALYTFSKTFLFQILQAER